MPIRETGRIARKSERITFQTVQTGSDEFRNRIQTWTDYFECSAYANTYEKREEGDEVISEEKSVAFECRWCPELAIVTSDHYRILFQGEKYNIVSIDPMNYQKKMIRFTCRREKR